MRFPVLDPRTLVRRETVKDDVMSGLVLGVESVPDGLASGVLAGVNPVIAAPPTRSVASRSPSF